MEYQIATGFGPVDLVDQVNALICHGWVPFGGVAIDNEENGCMSVYCQAMTREKKLEKQEDGYHVQN